MAALHAAQPRSSYSLVPRLSIKVTHSRHAIQAWLEICRAKLQHPFMFVRAERYFWNEEEHTGPTRPKQRDPGSGRRHIHSRAGRSGQRPRAHALCAAAVHQHHNVLCRGHSARGGLP